MSNHTTVRIGIKTPYFVIFMLLAYFVYEPLFWMALYATVGITVVFASFVLFAMIFFMVIYPQNTTLKFKGGFKFDYRK